LVISVVNPNFDSQNMKKPEFMGIRGILLLIFLVTVFPGCISTPNDSSGWGQNPQALSGEASASAAANIEEMLFKADRGDIFEGSSAARTPTIGILKPQGSYLSGDEQWILDMIKSAMNNNFRRFASGRIMVMNIADEAALNEEIMKSLSGSNDELSLSARMAARSIMTGRVIKIQGTMRFNLEFTITDTQTHAVLASYSQNHSDVEITEGRALNRATESLLKDLNVRLNDAGRLALYGASNEADTALAKGLSAAESGQGLQAMNYLFSAASFNTTASQASTTLTEVQIKNQRELYGAGTIVMDYFGRQELWQNRLDEYNRFYRSHAPFELFYTPPVPSNMRGSGYSRTYDINFKIGLRWNQNQLSVMEKVLQEYIITGLNQNPREDIQRWELRGLPDDSDLFRGPDNFIYNLMVNIENERGDVITSGNIKLNGSLFRYQDKIYAACTQEYDAAFSNIAYVEDKITPNIIIRIVSINGVNIITTGENGFIRVSQTQGMQLPAVQNNSLPRGLTNSMERELAAARDREKKEAEEREKQRIASEKRAKKAYKEKQLAAIGNSFRLGLFVTGGPIIYERAGTVDVSLEVGKGAVNFEAGIMFFPGLSKDLFDIYPGSDISVMGINLGLFYSFFGLRWFLNMGPGMTIFIPYDSNKSSSSSGDSLDTYIIPYLTARFDFRILQATFLRFGYRLDAYPESLYPMFDYRSFNSLGKFFFTHNVLFGIGFII